MSDFGLDTNESREAARENLLAAVQEGVDAAPANSAKWRPLKKWFVDTFGEENIPDRKAAEGKNITSENQVWNRLHNELPGNDPKYAVITAVSNELLPAVRRHLGNAVLSRTRMALILHGVEPIELQIYQPDDVTDAFSLMFGDVQILEVSRPEHAPPGPVGSGGGPTPSAQILVDDRVRRMVKLAISSSTAVILVGPPGTGKTRLLEEVIEEIRASPADYGFPAVAPPVWATPEESWTTRELLGGLTVDEKGLLRFREGYVLEAIRENRWLVLDETNRADMDKIFGGLMTWLSTSTEVNLGSVSTHFDAPSVVLGWSTEATCEVENESSLEDAEPSGDAVRFLAGTGWRLLGTYNALDAQRVFRFGAALGRRFARVPIPPPSVEMFDSAIAPLTEGLPSGVRSAIVGLYAAHLEDPATELGPALFTRLPGYVRTGLGLPALSLPEDGPYAPTDQAPGPAAGMPGEDGGDAADGQDSGHDETATDRVAGAGAGELAASRLLAEAYLVSVGTWLNRLSDEDRDLLGQRVVESHEALPVTEWGWVVDLASALG